jgi:hypothetical protein
VIKGAVANHMSDQAGVLLRYVLRDRNFEAIINRILQLLFAPDVLPIIIRMLLAAQSAGAQEDFSICGIWS